MQNKLLKKMYIILISTVLVVSSGVYIIVYLMSYSAMMSDIRERASGVMNFILDNLSAADLMDIGEDSESGVIVGRNIQESLVRLRKIGNLERLYVAKENAAGEIITTKQVLNGEDAAYFPSGELIYDLRRILSQGVAADEGGIYQTDYGAIYAIFWPIMGYNQQPVGVLCMEFDVDAIYQSHNRAALYSLALAVSLMFLTSVIAYLSISKVSEPFYKKMAYTDFLTGYENRMAFEHRLRECNNLADNGISVTLIIFDMNNLKVVNDTLGHKAGDAYIKNTADIIFKNLRGLGSLYRIGGDEFASLIVGKSSQEVQDIVDSLCAEKSMAIKTQPFSCACGAATFTKGVDKTMRDVFGRADAAMYTEKRRQKGAA